MRVGPQAGAGEGRAPRKWPGFMLKAQRGGPVMAALIVPEGPGGGDAVGGAGGTGAERAPRKLPAFMIKARRDGAATTPTSVKREDRGGGGGRGGGGSLSPGWRSCTRPVSPRPAPVVGEGVEVRSEFPGNAEGWGGSPGQSVLTAAPAAMPHLEGKVGGRGAGTGKHRSHGGAFGGKEGGGWRRGVSPGPLRQIPKRETIQGYLTHKKRTPFPTLGLCPGSWGGPDGLDFFYGRGTPVQPEGARLPQVRSAARGGYPPRSLDIGLRQVPWEVSFISSEVPLYSLNAHAFRTTTECWRG